MTRTGAAPAARVAGVVLVALLAGVPCDARAQRSDDATGDDPAERWCAPPAARTANVRAAVDADATLCLTTGERMRLLARQVVDPMFYGEVFLSSGWGQFRREPVQWGQDWPGFGRRLGAATASWGAFAVSEAATAALLGVDPRPTFARLADGRPPLRTALVNAVTLRRRDGTRVLALPRVAGSVAGGWAFGRLRPEGPDAGRIAADVAASFAFATAAHVGYEYWRWWRRPRTVTGATAASPPAAGR